ncbi:MAG TPA: sulfotransferase [Gemmatimonadota bacterium]|nr:sulfotransferase [Gemmatimonadota bacterium]
MTAGWCSSALSSLKLALGKSRAAWRRYPALRKKVRDLPSGPPILVTGMYRSGTTWVGAMLATPGVWHVHEPFNPQQGLWDREFDYARPEEARPDIDRLVSAILRGRRRRTLRMPHSHRWYLPIRLLPQRPKRVLIKDPSAALLAEYLTRRHGMRTLILFRHPAAVAQSFVRLDWPTGRMVRDLLESETLVAEWLEPMLDMMREALGRSDLFSGTVLYACVARVLDGFVRRNSAGMTPLLFEDLCADPIGGFRELYRELDLPYDATVVERHGSLCFPEKEADDRPHGVRRSSADMAERWKAELSPADVEIVRSTWERAGIDRYRGVWACGSR